VRLRKRDLRAPVKGDLDITFSEERISAHGGLEIVRRYLQAIDLPRRLRQALAPHGLDTDYGVVGLTLSILALIVLGGWRIPHLAFVGSDPIALRFAGLARLPSDRTLVRGPVVAFQDDARAAHAQRAEHDGARAAQPGHARDLQDE
jgi:hypothetical protein